MATALVQDVSLRVGQDPGLMDFPLLNVVEGVAYLSSMAGGNAERGGRRGRRGG